MNQVRGRFPVLVMVFSDGFTVVPPRTGKRGEHFYDKDYGSLK